MTTKNRKIGDFGESIACKFLMKRGFSIRERNYLKPWGEIDLIVERKGEVHFIEVKTSVSDETNTSGSGVRPEENIHPAKWGRMQRAISTYCMENDISEESIACDAVIVRVSSDFSKAKVSFLENIVL